MTTLHNKIGLIISTLCLVYSSIYSQHRFDYGLGLSHTNAAQQASSLGLDLSMKYKLKSIDLGLLINHSFRISGANMSLLAFNTFFSQTRQTNLILPESLFENYSRAELYINYRRKRYSNKPFIGIGAGLHRIHNREITSIGPSLLIANFEPKEQYFQSAVIRFGIPFEHFEFSSFVHITNYESRNFTEDDNLSFFGTSLKIFLRKEKNVEIKHSKIRLFSLHAGFSYFISVDENLADSFRPFLSLQYPINKVYELSFSHEFEGEHFGLDSDNVRKELNPEFEPIPSYNNISSSISALKMKIHRSIPSEGYTNFSYGMGIGIYRLPIIGRIIRQNQTTTIVPASSNLGPILIAGLKTKGLIVSIDLNLPIGKIPIHIGIHTGFNININKKRWRKGSHQEHDIKRI